MHLWRAITIIIIIKSKYQPFPLFSYFSMIVSLKWLYHHIMSIIISIYPGKSGFCFHCNCAVYDMCKYLYPSKLEGFICLFAHYTMPLSSLCKLIWKLWTYKWLSGIFCRVYVLRLSKFSQSALLQYMELCIFYLVIAYVTIVRICVLCLIIIIKLKYEPLAIVYGKVKVCAVCLAVFFWYEHAIFLPLSKHCKSETLSNKRK